MIVATTFRDPGSTCDTVPSVWLSTQTAPSPRARKRGPTPTGIESVGFPDAGSMRSRTSCDRAPTARRTRTHRRRPGRRGRSIAPCRTQPTATDDSSASPLTGSAIESRAVARADHASRSAASPRRPCSRRPRARRTGHGTPVRDVESVARRGQLALRRRCRAGAVRAGLVGRRLRAARTSRSRDALGADVVGRSARGGTEAGRDHDSRDGDRPGGSTGSCVGERMARTLGFPGFRAPPPTAEQRRASCAPLPPRAARRPR